MFFAAVAIRDRPELANKIVAVGSEKSVICTANYVARKYGVRSAMPGFIAKELCKKQGVLKDLVFVPPDFEQYNKDSEIMQKTISEHFETKNFKPFSLDEVYIDISKAVEKHVQNYQTPSHCANGLVAQFRRKIKENTNGLTCSAGIAPNFHLAKLCADVNKPDGQFEVKCAQNLLCKKFKTILSFCKSHELLLVQLFNIYCSGFS